MLLRCFLSKTGSLYSVREVLIFITQCLKLYVPSDESIHCNHGWEYIRIFHGCEVRIEKCVRGSLFGITRLWRVMPNSDPEGRIFLLFVCLCWGFTAQSKTRLCRAGQLIVALFLGRLRPSKRLTSTKRGRPRQ